MSTITDAVSKDELVRHTETIAQWVRLSGTEDERRAFEYIQQELSAIGYDVTLYESEALIGYPQEASLEILGEETVRLEANGYSFSPTTPEAGVTGELMYVGDGLPGSYRGIDVRGRIVLSDGLAMPGKALAAQEAGAIGHVHINDEYIHEMCISPVWGTPTPGTAHLLPTVPAVAVIAEDGQRLRDMLDDGSVTVRLTTNPYYDWSTIPTLIADLNGHTEDRYVLFSGHVDSWHFGAMDNGTANATQIEVARVLAERRDELGRGVRLAFWSGHSHGRYAGSAWYADTFWHDIHERCVCHVNVDSVGGIGATILSEAPSMAETYPFARDIMRKTVNVELDYKRMGRFSDQSFWGHGVPALFAIFSQQPQSRDATAAALSELGGASAKGGGVGWWWHTTEDTTDKIDPALLERDARVYAYLVWRLCTDEVLPFDQAEAAEELTTHLERYHELAQGHLDLAGAEAMARQLATEIRELPLESGDVERTNGLIMELSRLLIPVNYTRSGQFEHDLALGAKPIPGLADVEQLPKLDHSSSEFKYLRARLIREKNRVEHALRSALKRVNGFRSQGA